MVNHSPRRLLTAGIFVFAGLFLGRVAGFIREVTIASTFGVTEEADVVIFALTLPDFMVNILMGGALAAALIPELKKLNSENAHHLFLQSSLLAGLGFSLLVGVLVLFPELLVNLLAPGFTETAAHLSNQLIRYSLWVVPLTALAGVTTAYLQANNRFGVAALGTLIFNVTLVLTFIFFINDLTEVYFLGWAIIIAGFLRWISQWIAIRQSKSQSSFLSTWFFNRPLIVRYLQALGAGGLLLLMPVLAKILASFGEPGSFATINYFIKLVELPMGLWLGIFSVVLFPVLSELFAQGKNEEGLKIARKGIQAIFIFSYTFILVSVWFSEDLTRIVYEWGKMEDSALVQIAVLLKFGIFSLPAQGLSALMIAISNAKRDTKLPLVSSLAGIFVFIPLSWFMFEMSGLKGIILALVIAHWLVLGIQIILLKKYHEFYFFPADILKDFLKVLILGLLLFIPFAWLSQIIDGGPGVQLFLAICAALIVSTGTLLSIEHYRIYILKKLRLKFNT